MATALQKIIIPEWKLENGKTLNNYPLFYQVFGKKIGEAPIVLVNHALTGNSNLIGEKGWWNELIGENKTIDTNKYTVLGFNIPGNGYDGDAKNLIHNYKDFTLQDIAQFFWQGLFQLNIRELFAVIGGSLGGALGWQMTVLQPEKIQNLIPIATNWKATDWVIGNVHVQDVILNNSKNPIADARIQAMLLYRTPESLKQKFNITKQSNSNLYQIESWLNHHGAKLQSRFELSSYKIMNYLLRTIDVTNGKNNFIEIASKIKSNIHIIAVNSDCFFVANENLETYNDLKTYKSNVFYHEIKSIHGHDAFLIEFDQLNEFLFPIFH